MIVTGHRYICQNFGDLFISCHADRHDGLSMIMTWAFDDIRLDVNDTTAETRLRGVPSPCRTEWGEQPTFARNTFAEFF